MIYTIHHVTRFHYSAPVRESVMELRMQPRSESGQRPLSFNLAVTPTARLTNYRDHLGNVVHHFSLPGQHTGLTISAQARVEVTPPPRPAATLKSNSWAELGRSVAEGDYWEMLGPSHFAHPTDLLTQLAAELNLRRQDDPLTLLRELNSAICRTFAYVPNDTQADSPIDEALKKRQGVCQDFAHIMIALGRSLGIPCRYVSGYLFNSPEEHDRSTVGATHAWVEAWLPGLDWVGFDPTNNLMAGERHIRVATGRDYADVPPTRGIFKGKARSELSVVVQVLKADTPLPVFDDALVPPPDWSSAAEQEAEIDLLFQQQQQQQQ